MQAGVGRTAGFPTGRWGRSSVMLREALLSCRCPKRSKALSDLIPTHQGVVYPWQCDHLGHMNVMWYVGKFDEATWQLFAQIGLTPSYFHASGRGMAAVQQNISYKRELLAGDILEIRSRILEVRDRVLRFAHDMINVDGGEAAASCELTAVHLDRTARRSTDFEANIRMLAQKMIG